jgi:hypothetical protein
MYIPPHYNKLIPDYFRQDGTWYEEDCAIAIPCFILGAAYFHNPHSVRFITSGEAEKTVIAWYPYQYERYTGKTLQPGESTTKDEKEFMKAHASDWITIAAIGDHDNRVPPGHVAVCATVGGIRSARAACRYFIVHKEQYQWSLSAPFVVDPIKYSEATFLFR